MSSSDLECKCDFCCMEEGPIVASDGFLFRCSMKDSSYIPVEIIELNELIRSLQKRIVKVAERRRSVSLPSSPLGKKKGHENGKNNNSETLYLSRWRRDRPWSQSSVHRSSSSSSIKTLPHSIILKCSEKRTVSEESLPEVFEEGLENEGVGLKNRFTDQLAWVKKNGRDFVALETLRTMAEVSALLDALIQNNSPTLLQMKVNCSETVTVSYHFLDKFKQDFMMLKCHDSYCMFMAPF